MYAYDFELRLTDASFDLVDDFGLELTIWWFFLIGWRFWSPTNDSGLQLMILVLQLMILVSNQWIWTPTDDFGLQMMILWFFWLGWRWKVVNLVMYEFYDVSNNTVLIVWIQ